MRFLVGKMWRWCHVKCFFFVGGIICIEYIVGICAGRAGVLWGGGGEFDCVLSDIGQRCACWVWGRLVWYVLGLFVGVFM